MNQIMTSSDIPSFERMWANLGALLGNGKTIQTLSRQATHQARWIEDQGIEVITDQGKDLLHRDLFEGAWKALIHNKILTREQLPGGDDFRSEALTGILALLPYVDYSVQPRLTLFLKVHEFTNEQLSKIFGVGTQGGIRWAGQAANPQLVLFITDGAGKSTSENPYVDRWEGEVFHYCGAGLEGNQKMSHGNLALKSSIDTDYPVFGFEKLKKDKYAYMGRFKVKSVSEEQQLDVTGATRTVYMFSMRRIGQLEDSPVRLTNTRPDLPVRLDLAAIQAEFSAALRASHISFGPRHDEVVRSFIASLATKRLVILTGLSGSGKTQIALRFGEWLGKGRFLMVPVRPDWTGSEALFGYEDALQPLEQGRRSWHVPEALAFMLKAASDPHHPYLLVLDEMNLAHVERYFADVLSGMESGEPCLPNLRQEQDRHWRVVYGADPKIPFPTNLFIVGTVNVDETTYMFSPKVLDRANTFEFRVDTEDLSLDAHKPTSCTPGDPELVRGFLAIASDDKWHQLHPAKDVASFTDHLRRLHQLLREDGFEFGHRVFYEAVRFAAMLAFAGDDNVEHALDLQVMQKVLPRLHGNRRRLEPTLCNLGRFCFDLFYDSSTGLDRGPNRFDPLNHPSGDPRLPRSFDKVRRMLRSLRANQFTSFTE